VLSNRHRDRVSNPPPPPRPSIRFQSSDMSSDAAVKTTRELRDTANDEMIHLGGTFAGRILIGESRAGTATVDVTLLVASVPTSEKIPENFRRVRAAISGGKTGQVLLIHKARSVPNYARHDDSSTKRATRTEISSCTRRINYSK